MDCTLAQQILSEALDAEPVSAELLAEARAHCRECSECARFVRGLALIERSEPPRPPAGLHARVMRAIAAEREAASVEQADSQDGDCADRRR